MLRPYKWIRVRARNAAAVKKKWSAKTGRRGKSDGVS
jgi:hypothetical protein